MGAQLTLMNKSRGNTRKCRGALLTGLPVKGENTPGAGTKDTRAGKTFHRGLCCKARESHSELCVARFCRYRSWILLFGRIWEDYNFKASTAQMPLSPP